MSDMNENDKLDDLVPEARPDGLKPIEERFPGQIRIGHGGVGLTGFHPAQAAALSGLGRVGPVVEILEPAEGPLCPPVVLLRFACRGSNGATPVDARWNDVPILDRFTFGAGIAEYRPSPARPLPPGTDANGGYTFKVVAHDRQGYRSQAVRQYAPCPVPAATDHPPSGPSPDRLRIHLEIVSGDRQEGVIGRCVHPGSTTRKPPAAAPLVVRALDEHNKPVPGIPIRFDAGEDGGFVVDAPGYSTVTNEKGEAAVRYILSRKVGTQEVKASVLFGEEGDEPVTFTLTAYGPDILIENLVYKNLPVLTHNAEWTIRADVRYGGAMPEVGVARTQVVLRFFKDGVEREPGAGLYVGPEWSRQTDDEGRSCTSVVLLEKGTWTVKASLTEFPEIEERLVTGPKGSAIDADTKSGQILRGAAGGMGIPFPAFDVSSVIEHSSGSPSSGRIGALGHPVKFRVKVPKVPDGVLAWYEAAYHSALATWEIVISPRDLGPAVVTTTAPKPKGDRAALPAPPPPGSGSGTSIAGAAGRAVLKTGSLEETAEFWIEPPAGRAGLVSVEVWGVTASGVEKSLYTSEQAGVFGPEVKLVERDAAGQSKDVEMVIPLDPRGASWVVPHQYQVEARLPIDEPEITYGGSDSRDVCRQAPKNRDGVTPPTPAMAEMRRVDTSSRFARYRTDAARPLVYIYNVPTAVPVPASVPRGALVTSMPSWGFAGPFALAQDKVSPEVKSPSDSRLRFFSTGGFRDEVVKALRDRLGDRRIDYNADGFVSMAARDKNDIQRQWDLHMWIDYKVKGRDFTTVEEILNTIEQIADAKFRSKLLFVTTGPRDRNLGEDLLKQLEALNTTYQVVIKFDAEDTFMYDNISRKDVWTEVSGSRDVLIMCCHGSPSGGLSFSGNKPLVLPTATIPGMIAARANPGPAAFLTAACKSEAPMGCFLRPAGPCTFVTSRREGSGFFEGIATNVALMSTLFKQDPNVLLWSMGTSLRRFVEPNSMSGEYQRSALCYLLWQVLQTDRTKINKGSLFVFDVDSAANTYSDLSPYSR